MGTPASRSTSTAASSSARPGRQARTGFSELRAYLAKTSAIDAASIMIGATKIASTMSTFGSASTIFSVLSKRSASALAIRSTGLAALASAGMIRSSALRVFGERSPTCSPSPMQASVARIAGPPALVTSATFLPFGKCPSWIAPASAKRSFIESTRSTPHWLSKESIATSDPASEPVCEIAARAPRAVRPDLTTRIGFLREMRRAICMKRSGSPNASRYIRICFVAGSVSQYSSRSGGETSARLPTLANMLMPRPSERASARITAPSAPDCERNAASPRVGGASAKEAFIENSSAVFRTPMQFGPTSRMPYCSQIATSSSCRFTPSPPISEKPAVMQTMPPTPFSPQSRTASCTKRAGTTMIARSTTPGMAETFG